MSEKRQDIIATPQVCSWCFATLDFVLQVLQNKLETYERNEHFDHTLRVALHSLELPKPPLCIQEWMSQKVKTPLFVTWMLGAQSQDKSNELRGCIGTLDPVPIEKLAKYACEAAFNDTRFSPITLKELPLLECHVSFLFRFEICRHLQDWDIGIHGVRVTFASPSGEAHSKIYQSTFLPGVAKTYHMTHISTIENLIRKAGWRKMIDQTLLQSLSVERYQSSEATLTYNDHTINSTCYYIVCCSETPIGYDLTSRNNLPPLRGNTMSVWEPQKIEFTNTFPKSLPYHVNGSFPAGVGAGPSVGFPLSQSSYPYMEQPFGSSFVKQSNGENFVDSNKALLSETNIASILLSFPENQYSAGAHPERLHESVLESICYLVDRMCETIVVGTSQTVSLSHTDSEEVSSSTSVKRSAHVLPSDIFFYLKTHFGYNVEPNKITSNI